MHVCVSVVEWFSWRRRRSRNPRWQNATVWGLFTLISHTQAHPHRWSYPLLSHRHSGTHFCNLGTIRQTCYDALSAAQTIRNWKVWHHLLQLARLCWSKRQVLVDTWWDLCVFPTDGLSTGCFVPHHALQDMQTQQIASPTHSMSGLWDSVICILNTMPFWD